MLKALKKTNLIALALIAATSAIPAQALEGEPATQFVLEGLDKVHVTVGPMKDFGLDRAAIQKAVEEKFEKSGMKTISKKQFLNDTTINQFLVTVKPLKDRQKTFYSLNLGLTEMVFLEDKADRKISITAWQDQNLGVVNKKEENSLQKRIMERVDSFIDLWQRANGKEKIKS